MSAARRRGGFSLVEVLLALALLAGIAGGALGLLEHVSRRASQTRAHAARVLECGRLFDRLESALATCVAQGRDGSAGVRGDANSIDVTHLGVVGVRGGRGADQRTLALRWNEADRSISATFRASGVEQTTETLVENVERISLRYFHGARWRSSYDSVAQGAMPSAIELSVWFVPVGEVITSETRPSSGQPSDPRTVEDRLELEAREGEPASHSREPDRTRIIVIPDAPEASWEVSG